MLCYLLHQSPIWKKLPDGKRNTRIMLVGLTFYLFLHALTFEYKDKNALTKMINGYFIWFIAIDVFACACIYKLYYGRTILKELSPREKDYFDKKRHKYYPVSNNAVNINDIADSVDNDLQKNYVEFGKTVEPETDLNIDVVF
jgi:hypothetical protein